MATANGGVARVTHGHFEKFAQSRMEFVRSIAALAERPEYLEVSWRLLAIKLRPKTYALIVQHIAEFAGRGRVWHVETIVGG